eukprot:1949008-Rhodomonas_salina.1
MLGAGERVCDARCRIPHSLRGSVLIRSMTLRPSRTVCGAAVLSPCYGVDQTTWTCTSYTGQSLAESMSKPTRYALGLPTAAFFTTRTWVLEEMHKEGKLKAIGMSNYAIEDYEELAKECTVQPAINQIEGRYLRETCTHPFAQRRYLRVTCGHLGAGPGEPLPVPQEDHRLFSAERHPDPVLQ